MFGAATHDPEMFDNPEKFDFTRSKPAHDLTFGKGGHRCLGAPLGRLELKILFEEFSRRLPHLQLADEQNWNYPPTTTHRGPEHVFCTWDPSANPLPETGYNYLKL